MPANITLSDLMGTNNQKKGGMKKTHLHRVGAKKTYTGMHGDGRPLQISFQVRVLRVLDFAPLQVCDG